MIERNRFPLGTKSRLQQTPWCGNVNACHGAFFPICTRLSSSESKFLVDMCIGVKFVGSQKRCRHFGGCAKSRLGIQLAERICSDDFCSELAGKILQFCRTCRAVIAEKSTTKHHIHACSDSVYTGLFLAHEYSCVANDPFVKEI